MSYTTRFTEATVLQILEETDARNLGSNWNLQSRVFYIIQNVVPRSTRNTAAAANRVTYYHVRIKGTHDE